MRKVPVSVAVSVVAHGVVIAGVLAYEPAHTMRAPAAAVPIERVPAALASAAIEVGIIDAAVLPTTTRAPDDVVVTGRATTGRSAGRGGRGGGTRDGSDGTTSTNQGTGPSRWMGMRGAAGPNLALPGSFLESFGPGKPAEVTLRSGQITQHGRSFRSEQGVFDARIEPDGSVSLKDAKNLQIKVALPGRKELGNALRGWYEGGKPTLQDSLMGPVDPDDRSKTVGVAIIKGGFDITDALMRGRGMDPYASKKLQFLDATRDERVQMGGRHRARQLAETDLIVRTNLERLWASLPDLAARKQALFELWDEASETGDAQVVAAGEAARRQIIGFVRAHLPAGSAAAYTAAELAAFNRTKQSKQRFAPY